MMLRERQSRIADTRLFIIRANISRSTFSPPLRSGVMYQDTHFFVQSTPDTSAKMRVSVCGRPFARTHTMTSKVWFMLMSFDNRHEWWWLASTRTRAENTHTRTLHSPCAEGGWAYGIATVCGLGHTHIFVANFTPADQMCSCTDYNQR
jgi:hypothetical protein